MLKRNKSGFTLIETLLSLALASFIMMAMMQSYRMLVTYIERARDIARMNQRIALVCQIIERDLSCAVMPQLHKEIVADKKGDAQGGQTQEKEPEKEDEPLAEKNLSPEEKKKKKEERRLEERRKYFSAEIDDVDLYKIKGQRVELLKNCNFITTSALEVYGESSARWVRVRYELVRQKKTKVPEYILVRKQTNDIHNIKMKVKELDPTAKDNPIVSYDIARGIKGLYIEFSMKKEPEKKEEKDKKVELEEIKAFAWGEAKKTTGELPQRAHVYLELWNDARDSSELIELAVLLPVEGDLEKILGVPEGQKGETAAAGKSGLSFATEVVSGKKGNTSVGGQLDKIAGGLN